MLHCYRPWNGKSPFCEHEGNGPCMGDKLHHSICVNGTLSIASPWGAPETTEDQKLSRENRRCWNEKTTNTYHMRARVVSGAWANHQHELHSDRESGQLHQHDDRQRHKRL